MLKEKNAHSVEVSSLLLSDFLALSHPLAWSCSYAWLNELTDSQTYVGFATTAETLATISLWVEQDQRVFDNLLTINELLSAPTPASDPTESGA